MPPIITGRVVGAENVILKLQGAPERIMDAVRKTVHELGFELEAIVKTETLSGQVLHRQSGDLARSVNTKFQSAPSRETASVGTNKSYGRFWQLGFHGIENVRPHVRHLSSRNVHGRVATVTKSGKLSSRQGGKIASGIAFVSGHTRRVDQAARPFLTIGLAMLRPRIAPRIQAAARAAAASGGQTFDPKFGH